MKQLLTTLLFIASAALFIPTKADAVYCSILAGCSGNAGCGAGITSAANCTLQCAGGGSATCEKDKPTPVPDPEPVPVPDPGGTDGGRTTTTGGR